MASKPFCILHHRLEKMGFVQVICHESKMSKRGISFTSVRYTLKITSLEFSKIIIFLGIICWQERPEETSLITLSLEGYVKLSKALKQVIHTVFRPIWKMSTLRYDSLSWRHSNSSGDYKLNFQRKK